MPDAVPRGPRHLASLANVAVLVVFAALAILPWEAWLGGKINLAASLAPPSWGHPLGTDNMGRDLLVRIAAAVRGSVLPLWLGVVLGAAAGIAVACAAIVGERGRSWLRGAAVARSLDLSATVLAAVPIGLVVFAWAVWQEKAGIAPVLLALGALFAVRTYLETRDLYRRDAELAYWTAHRALGGALAARLWRYGLRAGWTSALLRTLAFHLRTAVAIEASLSYLGFGVQEPQASFGNMLASHFDLFLKGRFEVLLMLVLALLLVAAVPSAAYGVADLRARRGGSARPRLDHLLRVDPVSR